ncbi:MAG: hypothetical protein IT328_13630 [Caldilineaceae bacterium]|nr:hypothetical protein [Caldilineaceae bacterium]
MHNLIQWRRQALMPGAWGVALLVALCVAGCGRLPFGNKPDAAPAQVSASASNQGSTMNASLALQPASGYGGLYIQVNGNNWPQNMMVLVTLEDAQGRSETLAASDTDAAGNLTTGFLFPIDERWLASDLLSVVTASADGSIEAKAQFTVVPPGAEIAETSPSATDADAVASAGAAESGAAVSDPAESDPSFGNKVILPLVASSGVERSSSRGGRSSSSGAVTQVDVEIEPGESKAIDCRNGQEWITVVIFSSANFDATSVDASSVVVAGGSDLGLYGDLAENSFVALALPRPVQGNLRANQWQWHLDDVNGDGTIDMVMEFRFDYTELTCDAVVVAVTGQTKDGKRFEGSNRVAALALARG